MCDEKNSKPFKLKRRTKLNDDIIEVIERRHKMLEEKMEEIKALIEEMKINEHLW